MMTVIWGVPTYPPDPLASRRSGPSYQNATLAKRCVLIAGATALVVLRGPLAALDRKVFRASPSGRLRAAQVIFVRAVIWGSPAISEAYDAIVSW